MFDHHSGPPSDPGRPILPPSIEQRSTINQHPNIPMPATRLVSDHLCAIHVLTSTDPVTFFPDTDIYSTHAVLKVAGDAWRQDKSSVLAVCAFSQSPAPLQKATGIQADTADQFLSDMKFAHRFVPLGGKPCYVIRHHHGTDRQADELILPAEAKVVVYQPHALDPRQLSRLTEYAQSVRGQVILCDDPALLTQSHPSLSDVVSKSLAKCDVGRLTKHLERNDANPRPIPPRFEDSDAFRSQLPPPNAFATPRKYVIYHAKTEKPASFPGSFSPVAIVHADSIESALHRSQHFGAPWPDNPGVITFKTKLRSTQPGDVVVDNGVPMFYDGNTLTKLEATHAPKLAASRPQPHSVEISNPEPQMPVSQKRTFQP